jgi:ferredoxin
MNIDDKYRIAGEAISKAGGTPLPVNDTLIKIMKYFIMEDELDFIAAFNNQKSQTMDQLKLSTTLPEDEILKKTSALSKRGVIFNQPNSKGIMVYRLLPLINVGTFEYTFMGKVEPNERNREIAALFDKLFGELTDLVQKNYDSLVPLLINAPPVDRTVPVHENKAVGKKIEIIIDKKLDTSTQRILPTQAVDEIIGKFDEIAVGHCFCRHHKDLSGHPCGQTDERENCFTFGKSARYTSEQGFSRMITKGEAVEIMKRAEKDGLVHKAYHPNFDILKDETSICNCCKCCCANSIENLIAPTVNATNFLAHIERDKCTGCGTCVKVCHTDAAFLGADKKAGRKDELCIGCGICAARCPVGAISLVEGERIVRIPPRRR